MNVDDMTTKNDLISRSKLVSEIENAFQETGSNVDSLQKYHKKWNEGLTWAQNFVTGAAAIIELDGDQLISRSGLVNRIIDAQKSLESSDDKIWEKNKPQFKGLAWGNRLILDAPSVMNIGRLTKPDSDYCHDICGSVNGCPRLTGGKKRCRGYDLYERLKWYENLWVQEDGK